MKNTLLQNASKIITKGGSFFITKRGKILLQNAAAFLLQKASILLQNAASITKHVDFITKCCRYYKTRHLLQNGA